VNNRSIIITKLIILRPKEKVYVGTNSIEQFKKKMIPIGFVRLLLLLLTILCSFVSAKDEEERSIYVVNLEMRHVLQTKQILKEFESKGELEIQDEIEMIEDDVIHMTAKEAHKVSNLMGISSMKKDYWNYFHVMGWVDSYQPHEDDSNGERHLDEHIPYGLRMVNVAGEHGLTPDGITEPKKICVVDTGYTNGHPDLPVLDSSLDGYTSRNINATSWETDKFGHGTHVAGTIAAVGNNGIGMAGMVSDPDKIALFIGKPLSDEGVGELNDFLRTVTKCVEAGADIVSMSLGTTEHSKSDAAMFQQFYENENVLFVSAAGNDGSTEHNFPASYHHVMSVGAVDQHMNTPKFSQHNKQVEISAPGVQIYSTYNNKEYKYMSGTSMAVPHVTGVAALVWGHFPDCTNHQIRHALLKSAHRRAAHDKPCDKKYGYGVVDARAAYNLLNEVGCDGVEDSTHVKGGCSFLSHHHESTSRENLRKKYT